MMVVFWPVTLRQNPYPTVMLTADNMRLLMRRRGKEEPVYRHRKEQVYVLQFMRLVLISHLTPRI